MNKNRNILAFIGLTIAAFLGTLDSTIVNIALPDITNYFNSSLNDSSWVSTIYVLALSVFLISAAKLGDQFGRKKLMIIGLILFGLSSAMCGFSNSLLFLIIIRFIQGLSGAIITPIVLPMGLEIFGKEKRQFVVGASGAIVALAAASGPPIGGLLIQYMNWQAVFFVNVPLCILAVILIILFAKESYDDTVSKKIDWLGMLLITICLFCLVFGLLKGREYGWNSLLIISLFIMSAVTLILFIFIERIAPSPMIELSLFKESTFTASSICYMITGFATMSPILIFNYFLQDVLNYSALDAAFILMTISVTAMISIPAGSMLSKKAGTRVVNFLGILILGVGCILLSRVEINTTKVIMIFNLFICGIGLGFSCQAIASSIKYLPEDKSGIGSGIINAFRQIGTCIGIALLVSLLNSGVSGAKTDIKKYAVEDIKNHKEIITPVRRELIKIVNNTDKENNFSQNSIKKKLEKKLKNNKSMLLKKSSSTDNKTLAAFYKGANSLKKGAKKAAVGQNNLNSGINHLNSGLDALYNGTSSLTAGMKTLKDSLKEVSLGSDKLYTSVSDKNKGLNKLSDGIHKLNVGTKELLKQFESNSNSKIPTLYDGIMSLSKGAQNASKGTDNYISVVNSTLYTIISNDPTSPQLLTVYKNKLLKAKTEYSSSNSKNDRAKHMNEIRMLSNLINIYTAAINPSVNNSSDFEEKLISMGKSNTSGESVVYAGSSLSSGINKLSASTKKLAAQFKKSGTLKTSIEQLANGASKLESSTGGINTLETSIGKLNNALSKFSSGADRIYEGTDNIHKGAHSALNGSGKLKKGSDKLVSASEKIESGTEQIVTGLNMLEQKDLIADEVNDIKKYKNKEITAAFDKTFFIAAMIILSMSIFGVFTDKKGRK
ncbi:MFS transporter [Clostridium oryzae]|uniref:Multidrug resistance protein Stp n=1 Tax=Clostridium oryzae TaxID=1450648 RepID=A0A1V4IVW3_9CLOT|nr:MDR family MFS transporter [Clostridium oryzae]OPJ64033.1 multidrug resistance protein Stp [Clostridium oryzae]